MVGLVRRGPKTLLVETDFSLEIKDYFLKNHGAEEESLTVAFNKAGEDSTIVIIGEDLKEKANLDKSIILVINMEPENILTKIINDRETAKIKSTRICSRMIVLRVMGNLERVFDEIKSEYNAMEGSFLDMLSSNKEGGLIVCLTQIPLKRRLKLEDIYQEKCLFLEGDYYELEKELRTQGLRYLNISIENKDWYELEIRIYDMYGAFKLHYERLLHILEALELGVVLGSSWGKDYPKVLLAIDVYRVRFFTFLDPKLIKRILLGLEHLDNGMRIIDYDVYYNRRKVEWRMAVEDKKLQRYEASKKIRNEILSKLTEHEKEVLFKLEREILKTRR